MDYKYSLPQAKNGSVARGTAQDARLELLTGQEGGFAAWLAVFHPSQQKEHDQSLSRAQQYNRIGPGISAVANPVVHLFGHGSDSLRKQLKAR